MIVRRLVGTLSVALLATLAVAVPAAAGTYPPSSGEATVSATSVEAGATVTVSGDGFEAGCPVQLSVTQGGESSAPGQTLTADDDGNVSTEVTLNESGTNVITLEGCDRVLTATVEVAGDASTGGGLPSTGGNLTSLWAGIGLLLTGGLLVTVARSRRRITV